MTVDLTEKIKIRINRESILLFLEMPFFFKENSIAKLTLRSDEDLASSSSVCANKLIYKGAEYPLAINFTERGETMEILLPDGDEQECLSLDLKDFYEKTLRAVDQIQ